MGRTTEWVHGTRPGYRRHEALKVEICDPCRLANNAYRKERYDLNQRDYKKAYYQANKELYELRRKKYIFENPDYRASEDRRRRAKIAENGYEPYTLQQVLDTYGTSCHLCEDIIDLDLPRQSGTPGWQMGLHIDHVVPIAKGGPDTLDNVRPSHAICNLSKGAYHR
jgi:5-methylcytosine-specific restriction endonuclease McrA